MRSELTGGRDFNASQDHDRNSKRVASTWSQWRERTKKNGGFASMSIKASAARDASQFLRPGSRLQQHDIWVLHLVYTRADTDGMRATLHGERASSRKSIRVSECPPLWSDWISFLENSCVGGMCGHTHVESCCLCPP